MPKLVNYEQNKKLENSVQNIEIPDFFRLTLYIYTFYLDKEWIQTCSWARLHLVFLYCWIREYRSYVQVLSTMVHQNIPQE